MPPGKSLLSFVPEFETALNLKRPSEAMERLFGTLMMLVSPEAAEEDSGDFSWPALQEWSAQCGTAGDFLANLMQFNHRQICPRRAMLVNHRLRQHNLHVPSSLEDKNCGPMLAAISKWILNAIGHALRAPTAEPPSEPASWRSFMDEQPSPASAPVGQTRAWAKKLRAQGGSAAELKEQISEAQQVVRTLRQQQRSVKAAVAEQTVAWLVSALEHLERMEQKAASTKSRKPTVRETRKVAPFKAAAADGAGLREFVRHKRRNKEKRRPRTAGFNRSSDSAGTGRAQSSMGVERPSSRLVPVRTSAAAGGHCEVQHHCLQHTIPALASVDC